MSRCFVKYPWAVALSTFLLVCLLSAAGAQGFSEPVNTGWDNQQDPIRQRFDAYWKLMDQVWAPGLDNDDGNDRSRRLAAADWPQGGKRPTPGSWRAETAGPLTRLEWAEGRAVGVLGPEAYRRRSAWQGRRQRQLLEYNGEADVSLERSLVLDVVTLVYDAFEGRRMLSAEALEAMMVMERATLDLDGWKDNCQLAHSSNLSSHSHDRSSCASPRTVLNVLHRNDEAHRAQCQLGFCHTDRLVPSVFATVQAGLAWCDSAASPGWGSPPCTSTVYDWREGTLAPVAEWAGLIDKHLCQAMDGGVEADFLLSERFNRSQTACEGTSRYLRSEYALGMPRPGIPLDRDGQGVIMSEHAADYADSKFGDKLLPAALDGAMAAVSATPPLSRTSATGPTAGRPINVCWAAWITTNVLLLVYQDMALAGFSMAFIFLYVWFNIESFILALAGFFEILMSVPLALFVWTFVLGQENIDFLQLVGVFLILCVGADDIFVYMDTWKASKSAAPGISGTLETRFAWAWKRAAGTMLTTTLTTAICLVCTTFSPIPTVKAFGIFGSLLIIVDYIQVITWYVLVTTTMLLTMLEHARQPQS